MNKRQLPSRPNIELYKKLAKEVVKAWKQPGIIRWQGQEVPLDRYHIAQRHPRLEKLGPEEVDKAKFVLADAQFIIAREYGFESWPRFILGVNETLASQDPYRDFVRAACAPLDGTSHQAGDLAEANGILSEFPNLATKDIFVAAILGDNETVQQFLVKNPKSAKRKGGPNKWDALTYLCFSRYLRLDEVRSDDFVDTATALLRAGANANAGWYDRTQTPTAEWESVLYGASGFAQHAGVTKVLLNFGADPNDNETPYHAPETGDNRAVQALLDSGKLSAKSLSMMLIRKADWHDFDGVTMLLEHGADPNLMTQWGVTALHQAIKRDNQLATIELMLDHGADPYLPNNSDKRTAITMAARRGRGDVLNAIKDRGFDITAVDELERLIQACALDDREAIANASLEAIRMLKSQPSLLAEFAGTGNTVGVLNLLDLGIACDTRYGGDGYFGIPWNSTPLHVTSWKAHHEVVKLLIERGSDVKAVDGNGRTALGLAVRACVNSYWMSRRKPDSVRYLLEAGAKPIGIPLPCGYGEIDAMLTQSD
jgi:ankyrin repeat protein